MLQGRKQYLVHWVGYDSDQNTWEPVKNLCGYEDMMKECEEKRNQVKPKTFFLSCTHAVAF